ncbi:L-threonylcarbamoyladenylate synthase [Geopsychrobacter electrodiphilus]|uniref:L-threonylcarbamoyladenylate synthase n=1 Tax=Geopsychrobacter electrodiphilus TaxID=225196 RepID=UPI0003782B54|nr:L-threonylcarbamoyladenylate synthase [Geopsychrobacter electrodiphilus]
MRHKINPDNPQLRLIRHVVDSLRQGGVIIYPTDTTYGLGCDIFNPKGIKKIYQIKQRDPRKPFSFICSDLTEVANYAHVSNFAFRILKRHLPGPYTFILEASKVVPDSLTTRQKTVGIRIPDNTISRMIVQELGHPLVTTSANISGENVIQDPEIIDPRIERLVDVIVDGGPSMGKESSVISLIGDRIEVLREGAGDLSWID